MLSLLAYRILQANLWGNFTKKTKFWRIWPKFRNYWFSYISEDFLWLSSPRPPPSKFSLNHTYLLQFLPRLIYRLKSLQILFYLLRLRSGKGRSKRTRWSSNTFPAHVDKTYLQTHLEYIPCSNFVTVKFYAIFTWCSCRCCSRGPGFIIFVIKVFILVDVPIFQNPLI